jgi:hypothetical protein
MRSALAALVGLIAAAPADRVENQGGMHHPAGRPVAGDDGGTRQAACLVHERGTY